MATFTCNTSSWPVVNLRVQSQHLDKDGVEKVLEAWAEIYVLSMKTGQQFTLILDAGTTESVSMDGAKLILAFLLKVKHLTEKWMDCTVLIMRHAALRVIIKFVLNVYTPVRPFKVVQTLASATKWINDRNKTQSERAETTK